MTSDAEKGRYAITGVPVPRIFADKLNALSEALRAAQIASQKQARAVRVVKHYKNRRTITVGTFTNGEQQ